MLNHEELKELKFDEESHTYTYDGDIVPSVTQILKEAGLSMAYKGDNSWYAERGTVIHDAVALIHSDAGLDEKTIDPEIAGYISGYMQFLADTCYVPIAVEKMVYHQKLKYAGRIDSIGYLGDSLCLIDIKTGSTIPQEAMLQLGMYIMALKLQIKGYVLQLKKDGNYKLRPVVDTIETVETMVSGIMAGRKLGFWK